MSKHKKAASLKHDPPKKDVRVDPNAMLQLQSSYDQYPVWQFKHIDFDHRIWGWKNVDISTARSILGKLKNYETMLWKNIHSNTKRDHSVNISGISREAQKRLEELKLDDVDELYRIRLNGEERIWGILHGCIFKIVWWDPNHTVCPSKKKHT